MLAYQRFPSDSHPSKMAFSIHIEGKMIKRNFQQRLKLHNLQNDGSNFLVCTNISTLNAPIFSQQDKYKNTKIQIHKHKMLDETSCLFTTSIKLNIKCTICTIGTIWSQMSDLCTYVRTVKTK